MMTYDIINAGPKNRFMTAGRIVSNSGRLVQFQNLPQNHLKDLNLARDLIKEGRFEDVELLFGNTPNILSELIRTTFIPKPNHRFIVADFSAIEARVISWLAGEKWRLEVFASHGKIYEAAASLMFHVPIESVTKGSPLRQKGKISELACIAEGELVLTDKGLVPIENITTGHKLWDGEEWVSHEGVIYKGKRKVIEYEGLRATEDHLVWIEEKFVTLGEVVNRNYRLTKAHEYYSTNKETIVTKVYDILNAGRNNRFTVSGKLVHNCGYGGGVGALKAMGAIEMGVEEHELQGLIDNWRVANPHIVSLWWDVDKAAIDAVRERGRTSTHGIIFTCKSGMLFVTLPSGRNLVYVKPKLSANKFGREGLTYEGIGTTKKWERIETYGPKIVENIIQAIARDILAEAMLRLDNAGFNIVAHCHDEAICEVPIGQSSVEEICNIMSQPVSWAKGLPLKADGYECSFYQKD